MSLKKSVVFFLLSLFFIGKISSQNSSFTPYPVFSDQELEVRIKNLSSLAVTPHLDRVVKSYIKTYSVTKRDRTERMIGKAVLYFPIFEKYLLENNMPEDIKYLSVVESALNPEAKSRVGAGGLWQFMPGTGKEYGLKITNKLDERSDPHKSTKAAIAYLKRLYNKYQNWELALAAYNSGPGRVNRAIRRGKSKNFWKIKKYLPRETRNYVPAFVAANYIMNNYHLHYLNPQFPELDMQLTDYTKVYQSISFREISDLTGTPLFIIQSLNPSFKQGIIPSSRNGHYLILPKRNLPAFLNAFPSPDNPTNTFHNGRLEYFKSVYYVKAGDNIDKLAKLFNCHRRHIMAWNNMPQPYLARGQELIVYQISNSISVKVEKLATISPKLEKPQLKEETILATSISKNKKTTAPKKKETLTPKNRTPQKQAYEYHYIRRNESIIDIAEKYKGVSIQDILKLNNIKENNLPTIGSQLKIKKM